MRIITNEENMKSRLLSYNVVIATFVLVLIACALPGIAAAQTKPATPAAAPGPKAFDTPQQAADALIKAAADYDVPELMAIFGPDGEDFIESRGSCSGQEQWHCLCQGSRCQELDRSRKVESEPGNHHCWRGRVAVPGSAGEEKRQVVFQRQGRPTGNSLPPHRRQRTRRHHGLSRLCRGAEGIRLGNSRRFRRKPVRAENLQHSRQAGRPVLEECRRYARRARLAMRWPKALAEGYTSGKGGFHGYYFKILKGQGPAAPNGAINYVIEGVMIGGFALVAVPAEYRVTGVKTFIVNYDGIVYQKDLGPGLPQHRQEHGALQPGQDVAANRRPVASECGRSQPMTG